MLKLGLVNSIGRLGRSGNTTQKFISFDGTANSVLSVNSEDFNFSGGKKFSIGFWFNAESLNSSQALPVFFRGDSSNIVYSIKITHPNVTTYTIEYRSYANGISNGIVVSSNATCLKGWNFILITCNGSDLAAGIKLYCGGIQNTLSIVSDALAGGGGMNINKYPNYIGRYYSSTYSGANSALADLIIFNDELTYDEYQELFFADFTKSLSSLTTYSKILSHYQFNGDIKDIKGTHHLTATTTNFINAIGKAYLSPTGNNSTAQVNNTINKYQTITAAIAGLILLKSRYSYLYLENGDYVTAPDTDSIHNLSIIGMTMPIVDNESNPTKLINGTVIKGKGSFTNTFGLTIQNIGFDAGYEWTTNYNGGVATDGLVISGGNLIQPRSNKTSLKNVTCLCRAKDSLYHALLTERCYTITLQNINTYYGVHGIVFKGNKYTGSNLNTKGHNSEGFIIKKDSDFVVGNINIIGLTYRNINSSTPSAAINIGNGVVGQSISNVTLLNCDLIAADLLGEAGTLENIIIKDTNGNDILP